LNKIATVLGTETEHGSGKKYGTGAEHVTLYQNKMFKFCINSNLK
jgi:hypothetical protein